MLTYGADRLVAGCSALALRLGVSPLFIGLTIVAIATSSPELIVSISAGLSGSGAIAVGNVVGSNIANIGLVLGLSAMIYPVVADSKTVAREMPIMAFVVFFLFMLMYNGIIQRYEGIALVILLVVFLRLQIKNAYKERETAAVSSIPQTEEEAEVLKHKSVPLWLSLFYIAIGTASLYFGSDLFLTGAVSIGIAAGVSEAVIGLTVVSVGTSLPELAASGVAAFKKETDMALGNILGSNIFNVLAVLGITSLIIPLEGGDVDYIDLSVMMAFTLGLWLMLHFKLQVSRISGFAFFAIYVLYTIYLFAWT